MRKESFFFAYEKGKLYFFQKIERKIESLERVKNFDRMLQQEAFQEVLKENKEKQKLILLGEYEQEDFLYWEEKFPICSIENLKISKVSKEIDIFHHKLLSLRGRKGSRSFFSIGIFILLLGTTFLGFYFQYQLEEKKILLAKLEEENKILAVDIRKLEAKMTELRKHEEVEQEEEKIQQKKIIEDLKKIYTLGSHFEILCLESLETGEFKLQFLSFSTREYTKFIRNLLLEKFQFVNHDSIEKKQEEYKIELEIKKDEP